MTYAKYSDTCVLRVNDFKYINKDVQTEDWQAYQDWLATGKVPLDGMARLPDPVPSVQIRTTDAGMARIAEDIIGVLISKGVIAQADLPASVQTLLSRRQALRAAIASE